MSNLEPRLLEKDGESFEALTLPGESTTYERGRPLLPAVSRFVIVSPDAGLELEVGSADFRRVPATRQLALCDDPDVAVSMFEQTGIYPSVPAEMSEPVVIRGVRLVKVTVYPIQYDYGTNEYIIRDHIDANIRYNNDPPVNPASFPIRRNRSAQFKKFISALAVNGDEVGRDDPDEAPSYNGHYLVVSPSAALLWHLPFIEWRRKAGYKMDIVSLSANDANNPGTVLNRIRDAYAADLNAGVDPFDHLLLIGDRQTYDGLGPAPSSILQAEAGNTIWGGAPHADYRYALLEGNDNLPDVAFGRFPSGNQGTANLVVGRTLAYEATPRMDNPEWFNRVSNYSQHWGNAENSAWHVTIHTNARWGEEVLKKCGYTDVNFYELYDWDQVGQRVGPFIRDELNAGTALMIGRAENYFWRNDFGGVNNNTVFPINICVSGHGEWTAWNMFRTGDGNSLKGPVAATFGWGGPPTCTSSYVWMAMVNKVLQEDMTLGWGRTYAITSIESVFPNFNTNAGGQQVYLHVKTDIDFHGDPGIQPWVGVPRVVRSAFPDTVGVESRMVELRVTNTNNEPVEGATVSLYAPGSLPVNDAAQYAGWDQMIQKTALSDADGFARFIMGEDEAFTNNTLMYLTVTGRDICPRIGQARVATRAVVIDLGSFDLTEVEGNGDDVPNPGEDFALALVARNLGNRAGVEGVRATITSNSPWVTVEENDISFGDIDAGASADGDGPAQIHFDASTPDGVSRPITQPELIVTFTDGNRVWKSAIKISPAAPHFQLSRLLPDNVIEYRAESLDIDLNNIGSRGGAALTGRLVSRGLGVTVVRDRASYPAIAAGAHSRVQGDAFSVVGNQLAVPGSKTPMLLILSTEGGFVDSVEFMLQVSTTREGAPLGPDKFGYISFDDSDDDWDIAPDYEWIEINPDAEDAAYEGTRVNFEGRSTFDVGECWVVDLGFSTQFYGESFDQVTISTNGFVSMGEQPRITNFQNWPLDKAIGGGVGMIAPFWDDLRFGQGTGVFVHHDADSSRFIIEWYRMRSAAGNTEFTFQIVLYDHRVWVTETGDQNILFQYKTVSELANIRNGDAENDTNIPYASVGISSPRGDTGINCCFRNVYPTASADLANRRAILFSTSPRFRSGNLKGRVLDFETGEPMDSVTVGTQHGFMARTDAEGYWRINGALADVEFYITARKDGFNDSTLTEQFLPEDDSLEIDFALRHPEFTPTLRRLTAGLNPDEETELEFQLHNGGNGMLDWNVTKRLIGDANAAPWELRRSLNLYNVTRDDRISGAVFVGDRFYLAGANGDRTNMIWVLNRDGALVDSFAQHGFGRYGHKDLEWDGELIWGSGDSSISAFTTEGELVHQWEGPLDPTNNIAYDSHNGIYWLSGITTNIFACDAEGNVVRATLNRKTLRIYGLAYWPEDPDGYNLYLATYGANAVTAIYKMNTETGDTIKVQELHLPQGATGLEGASITNMYDVYSWVLMTVPNVPVNGGGDRLEIYQLDARKDWFNLDQVEGSLAPGEDQEFVLSLNATDLPTVTFEGELVFSHNAEGLRTIIPVVLEVRARPGNVDDRRLQLAAGWNTVSVNVQPENSDIEAVCQPLTEMGALRIVKDGSGRFYRPDNNFNNIPSWNSSDGYLIFMNENALLQIEGIILPPDQPIPLEAGWNLKSYLPRDPMQPADAIQSIADRLLIVKDGSGHFYLPEFDYSNMDPMSEGHGYFFRMGEADSLVYPAGGRAAAVTSALAPVPTHFVTSESAVQDNLSLLIIGGRQLAGFELGVYAADRLVGSGTFDAAGNCGVAVWGDDPATDQVEGAGTGDPLELALWDGLTESSASVSLEKGELKYQAGEIAVARIGADVSPVEFGLSSAYPNPFNGRMTLAFGLREPGETTLAIYDMTGRSVATLYDGVAPAGVHRIAWDGGSLPTGLYIARLESNGRTDAKKLMLMK